MRMILFLLCSIAGFNTIGQRIFRLEEVIYDKDRNIICSLDYFGTYGHVETTFRDTSTNIRYKLDESHHFLTALTAKGDTLWNIDPYVIARKQYTLKATTIRVEYENLKNDDTTINPVSNLKNDSSINPAKKDTIWVEFDNIDRPDHITAMKFGNSPYDKDDCKKGELVLYIKADTRYYGFVVLKTGKFYFTRSGS